MSAMKELDCFGEICPIPVMMILKEIKTMKPGETVKMISDHSCVVESVRDRLKKEAVSVEVEEVMNGVWEIFVTKC